MIDPDRSHPEIEEFARLAERRFDLVLEAEHEAAMVNLNRVSTLHDRLLDLEDRRADVTVTTVAGSHSGRLTTVGLDHVVLSGSDRRTFVRLDDVIAVIEP